MPEAYQWKLKKTVEWMNDNLETTETRFHGFKDYEIQRLQRIIDQMDPKKYRYPDAVKSDFYKFFAEHDKRRATNFLETFPEMSEWYDECKYWAEQ
jgi:hypothetical protein